MKTDIVGTSVGIIGIIIGIIVSYYFYRKSLRLKEPSWAIRSNNIIEGYSDKVESLSVLYKNAKVENLTISKILFWNDGEETINRQDTETINRLRIEPNTDIRLLDAKVLVNNNRSSQFDVVVSDPDNCAYIAFEYLDQNQGAVIQVIHTGKSSKDLQVVGDIKGVKMLKNKVTTPKFLSGTTKFKISRKITRKLYGMFAMLAGITYIVIGIIKIFVPSFISASSPKPMNPTNDLLINLIVFFGGGVLMLFMGYSQVRVIAPKGLEVFHEE